MPEIDRLTAFRTDFELGFVEQEATPEPAMKLGIQLPPSNRRPSHVQFVNLFSVGVLDILKVGVDVLVDRAAVLDRRRSRGVAAHILDLLAVQVLLHTPVCREVVPPEVRSHGAVFVRLGVLRVERRLPDFIDIVLPKLCARVLGEE